MTTINPLRKKRLKDGNINSRGAFKPPENQGEKRRLQRRGTATKINIKQQTIPPEYPQSLPIEGANKTFRGLTKCQSVSQ
jgi:hypothetical protein